MAAEPSRAFEVTHRGVLAIALPMTLAYLTTPLVGVVSLGVIGQLGDPAQVGGVSIGGLIFDIVFMTFSFLRSGTTGLVAQSFGAGDRREIAATLARAALVAVVIGIAIVAVQAPLIALAQWLIGGSEEVQAATRAYWQIRVFSAPLAFLNYVILGWLIGLGRAGFGLGLQIVLNGINIALSIALVHGLGWGVAGVGTASLVAEGATVIAGVAVVWWLHDHTVRPSLADVMNRAAFWRLFAINRDIMIRTFALLFAFAFFTARCAKAGDVILAANEILMNLVALAAYFLDGIAAAAEQLAGRAIGARHRPAFARSVRLTVGWGYAIGAFVSVALWLAGPGIIDMMTTSEAVRATARQYLWLAALFPIVGTLAYQMDGVFIGATWSSDMRNMMFVALAAYLAAWWPLERAFGITGVWLALLLFLVVRGATLVWRSRVRIGPAFSD